jgi:uncharacterized protein YqeY
MKLQNQLQADLSKLAMKRNNPKKELLKVVIAEISRYKFKDVPDEEVLRIIRKMKDNAIECGNLHEVPILEEYLPKMMSESDLRIYLKSVIENKGFYNIGQVMQYLKQDEKSAFIDKGMASKIVREML